MGLAVLKTYGIIKFGIRFCPRCFSCQKFLFSEFNGRRISLSFVPFLAGLLSMEGSLLSLFQWISVSWGLLWINLIVWDVSVLHPILQGRQRHGLGLLSKALFFPIAHLRVYQLPKRKSWKTGLLMPPKETAAA
jgi:hypothetical protein